MGTGSRDGGGAATGPTAGTDDPPGPLLRLAKEPHVPPDLRQARNRVFDTAKRGREVERRADSCDAVLPDCDSRSVFWCDPM